jgi:hypothetical protein
MEAVVLAVIIVVVVIATSLLKLPWFTETQKVAVATAVSTVGALGHVWYTTGFELVDIAGTLLQVHGGAQLLYAFILNNSALDRKLESVGVGTNYDPNDA